MGDDAEKRMIQALLCPECKAEEFRLTADENIVECSNCKAKCYMVLLGKEDEQSV